VQVKSTRFGELDVAEKNILAFPHGMPGFPEENKFAFLEYQQDSPFYFLQSMTDADLAFLLIDPFAFFTDYEFSLDDQLAEEIGLTADNPPSVFNIATVKDKAENMTVNLVAPLLINARDRKAVQIVLEKSDYPTRYRLFAPDSGNKTLAEGSK